MSKNTNDKGVGIKPGAHPTAPGGMSQKALIAELLEKHDYTPEEAHEFKPQHMWGRLVEQVVVERLEREKEAKEAAAVANALSALTEEKPKKKGKKGKKAKGKKAKADTPTPEVEEIDDLREAEVLLAEVEADLAEAEPTTEEKAKRAAPKAQQAIENIEAVLSEPEPEVAPEFTPVKDYQRKPVASSMAKFPHIHLKGLCLQNREAAPCNTDPHPDNTTAERVETDDESIHADATIEREIEDIDIESFFEEMSNERAAALAEQAALNPPLFIPISGVKDYVFDGHMGAGPSGAERWMNCAGSLDLTRKFLETLTYNQQKAFATSSLAARQGTTAHAAAEVHLNLMLGNIKPKKAEKILRTLATEPSQGEEYDEEMGEWLTQYTDLVRQYADAGHHVEVEARLEAVIPLPTPLPNGDMTYTIVGSGDFIAEPSEENPTTVTVGDLKYGDALWVEVDENPQVRIYALGALAKIAERNGGNLPKDLDTVDYHIIQPRLGGIKSWTEPLSSLLAWRDDVLAPALSDALRGLKGGASLTPGDQQCQWCPVRGSCPALTKARQDAADEMFTDLTEAEFKGETIEAEPLSNEKIGALLTQVNGLVSLRTALKEEVERRLYRGEKVPGFNLVNYTPPRSWTEEAKAKIAAGKGSAKHLTPEQRDALFREPTLLTPKQAIDTLVATGVDSEEAAALLSKYIVTPDKRPVVAPEGDRRSLWTSKPPEQMFPDLTDEELKS